MKLPRDLKGSDLAKALCRDWGYRIVHQEGSHLILQTEIPSHQRISIPDHTAGKRIRAWFATFRVRVDIQILRERNRSLTWFAYR